MFSKREGTSKGLLVFLICFFVYSAVALADPWMSSGLSVFLNDSSSIVGIGTPNPYTKLDLLGGRARFSPNSENFAIGINYNLSGNVSNGTNSSRSSYWIGVNSNGQLLFSNSNESGKVTITQGGFVGIGTLTPQQDLVVVGRVNITKGLNVTGGIRVSELNSPSCDLKADANGNFYCGNDNSLSDASFVLTEQSSLLPSASAIPREVLINEEFMGSRALGDITYVGVETITLGAGIWDMRTYANSGSASHYGVSLGGTNFTSLALYNSTQVKKFETRLYAIVENGTKNVIGIFRTNSALNLNTSINGLFFNFTAPDAANHWYASSCTLTNCTVVDTNITPSSSNLVTFTITTDTKGNYATFYINYVKVANITTNLPISIKTSWIGHLGENLINASSYTQVDYIYLNNLR